MDEFLNGDRVTYNGRLGTLGEIDAVDESAVVRFDDGGAWLVSLDSPFLDLVRRGR